jgi:hypothetical protein
MRTKEDIEAVGDSGTVCSHDVLFLYHPSTAAMNKPLSAKALLPVQPSLS